MHGYLISEFLSPGINLRDDEYGGSFENRVRFLKEILSEIKAAAQIFASMRISAQSCVKGDWSLEDSVRLAKELELPRAAFIHVWACGLFERTDSAPAFTPLYQADYAKVVKQAVGIPVIAARLITKASEGEALLLGGVCDAVAYGRGLLRNLNFAQSAMSELGCCELMENSHKRAFK